MRQQKHFGKKGQKVGAHNRNEVLTSRSFNKKIDEFEDPVLVRFAADKPWPALLSACLTCAITAGIVYSSGDLGPQLLYILPLMLLLGGLLHLQFKGLQKSMQGKKEKRSRAIQAQYPLIPISGVIGGLIYFMITKGQSMSDIMAYDWSEIFGLRTDIEGEEPLTAILFNSMAFGGGASIGVAALWYKLSKGTVSDQ